MITDPILYDTLMFTKVLYELKLISTYPLDIITQSFIYITSEMKTPLRIMHCACIGNVYIWRNSVNVLWKYLPNMSLRVQPLVNRVKDIKELQLIKQYLSTTKHLYDNYMQLRTHAWRKPNTQFKVDVSYENDGLWN